LDAAITKVFQWMEFDGYHFNQALAPPEFRNQFRWLTTLGHTLVTELGRMPANLPRGFVDGSVLMGYMIEHQGFGPERFLRGYESVGRHVGLYPYINEMDRLHRERGRALAARNEYRDFPLSEFEVDRALEALRGFDCANLRRQLNGESLTAPLQFHGFFRTSFSDNDIACPEGQMPWDVLN
jgi:hypothetical protein